MNQIQEHVDEWYEETKHHSIAAAGQDGFLDSAEATCVQILHTVSVWTNHPDTATDPKVADAIGTVGVKLLVEWYAVALAETQDASAAATQCSVGVVNVLLQCCDAFGSFSALHRHKLNACAPQQVFQSPANWNCSQCQRPWELQASGPQSLVHRCSPCDFTLCSECFAPDWMDTAESSELFRPPEPFHVERFLLVVLTRLAQLEPELFAALAPKLAVAARARLQELPVQRATEMAPPLDVVLAVLSVPGCARLLVETEPEFWLVPCMYIAGKKLRHLSFLGPLLGWTTMTSDGEPPADWLEGFRTLKRSLARLVETLLRCDDAFVVDAALTYAASMVAACQSRQSDDDTHDGVLVNLSSALVQAVLPVLTQSRHLIQTAYHEGFTTRRAWCQLKPEPLRKPSPEVERAQREADDRRVRQQEAQFRREREQGTSAERSYYYPVTTKHEFVQCDFCLKKDFVGVRYKCAVCDDSDLCADCYDEFTRRPVVDETEQDAERLRWQDRYHCTNHVFLRLDVPIPLLASDHYEPIAYDLTDVMYPADGEVAHGLSCAECKASLDNADVIFKCSNCHEPRIVCVACLEYEERHHDPREAHVPGHLYMGIPRNWRQRSNARARGLFSRGLVYPACVYPRERFNIETELVYVTIKALHVGPLVALANHQRLIKEIHELEAFCACEEKRIEHEKEGNLPSSPKLASHYAASKTRLLELEKTRWQDQLHLLELSTVVDWIYFYAEACRWLLGIASPSENPFEAVLTQFTAAFSLFPEHFFFDLCEVVQALTLGQQYPTSQLLEDAVVLSVEPLLVMLVQLVASKECTKNPHLRVEAAKALSSLFSFSSATGRLLGVLQETLRRCTLLRNCAVDGVLQFHEDMESYHVRNSGMLFDSSASNGDHLLWGFLSIRATTALLLRFLWQFPDQRDRIERAFRARTVPSPPTSTRLDHQVSLLVAGLWNDAAKLLEEGNAKAGLLTQMTSVREAIRDGRQIPLPFRPSMLEGYIALHSKHLRLSMRMLVEVLEYLTWLAGHAPLRRAMLKPGLMNQCVHTTNFLLATVVAAIRDGKLKTTWHHEGDAQRVLSCLVLLVVRCADGDDEEEEEDAAAFLRLVEESASSMLRFLGDVGVHGRWSLGREILRLETMQLSRDDDEAMATQRDDDAVDQLGDQFVSLLSRDGRFDYAAFLSSSQWVTNPEKIPHATMEQFSDVLRRCHDVARLQSAMDELLADVPPEFLDPLLHTIMTDPVRLPSGNIVDRAVIERQLLAAERVDPFTRQPLSSEQLEPCGELRQAIVRYLRAKREDLDRFEEETLLAAGGLSWNCVFDEVRP